MSSSSHQKTNGSEQKPERKRRRRTAKEKHEIAEASLKPGASVREVAQTYGVHPSQVGKWRRQYRSELLEDASAPALLAVRIAEGTEHEGTSRGLKPKRNPVGIIHIEFVRARVSIEGMADTAMVRAVLECLAE